MWRVVRAIERAIWRSEVHRKARLRAMRRTRARRIYVRTMFAICVTIGGSAVVLLFGAIAFGWNVPSMESTNTYVMPGSFVLVALNESLFRSWTSREAEQQLASG